ncbi:MAG: helix-turn-helix transcriptional regulator [Vicinamibacterales bacterium]
MPSAIGLFELLLLLAVRSEGDEAYGVPIRGAIEAATGKSPSSGAIYTTLERLEARGLVLSSLGDGSPLRGGRPRRYYRLTAEGRRVAASHSSMVQTLASRSQLEPSDV